MIFPVSEYEFRQEEQGMEKRKRWFAEYYLYFVLCSILGWLYEVFPEVVVYRWGFSNRGVLLGPWCVVYGTGALLLIFCLGPLQRRPVRLGRVNLTLLWCSSAWWY